MSEESEQTEEKRVVTTITDDVCVSIDAEMFKDLFELMTALFGSEVVVMLKDDGLYVRQMEEVRIALTDMFIPKSYFRTLKVGKEVKELNLSVNDTKSILLRLFHGDVLTFTVKEGKLHIEISGKRLRTFDMPLLGVEEKERERRVPRIICTVKIKTTIEGLLSGLEDATRLVTKSGKKKEKNLYGQVTLTTTAMGLKMDAVTEDELYKSGTLLSSGWDIMRFEGGMDQCVSVAIPYLMDIVKTVAKVTNMIQIEFSKDSPLHIIAELPFRGMKLEFWIAPRLRVEYSSKKEGGESNVET